MRLGDLHQQTEVYNLLRTIVALPEEKATQPWNQKMVFWDQVGS